MQSPSPLSPIIVAIDKPDLTSALALADSLDPKICRLKVGKELFTRCGSKVIEALHQRSFEVFLDLKFHDIPNTTAQAVLAAADMGIWMVNVHASAGIEAMRLAKQTLLDANHNTLLIAVTVLTSLDADALRQLGQLPENNTLAQQVERLALCAQQAGLDGVVCSAQEAGALKQLCGQAFNLVTPGIRMSEDDGNDQKRICTPKQAVEMGSDYLVIGRSITQADNPNQKMQTILESLEVASL